MNTLNFEKITNEYEKTLVIPAKKPSPLFFLCPVGLVGAGKTTVMKPLCEKLDVLRIANDEIRQIIKDPDYFDQAPKITAELGPKYARQGYSIGVDSNASSLWQSEYFDNVLKEFNAKAIWIYINPPESYILNKLKNYPHSWLFKDTTESLKTYQESKQKVKTEGIPFVYEFDPSRDDLNEQIEAAVKKIQEELRK